MTFIHHFKCLLTVEAMGPLQDLSRIDQLPTGAAFPDDSSLRNRPPAAQQQICPKIDLRLARRVSKRSV